MTDDSKDRWSALCRRPLPCGRRWSVVGFRSSVIGRRSSPRQQHLWPLAPGLPRRPWAAAYGLGPSVFTIPAKKPGTDRASVSQAVACRGAPPLPPMSLGTCRRCCRGGTPDARKPVSAFLGRKIPWSVSEHVSGLHTVRSGREFRWPPRSAFPLAVAKWGRDALL